MPGFQKMNMMIPLDNSSNHFSVERFKEKCFSVVFITLVNTLILGFKITKYGHQIKIIDFGKH